MSRRLRLPALIFVATLSLAWGNVVQAQGPTKPDVVQMVPAGKPAAKPASQTPSAPSETDKQISASIDEVVKPLADIQKTIEGGTNQTEKQLAILASETAPVATKLQALVERLTARTGAMKARVDQLGPKPDEKAAPESPEVVAQRASTDKAYADSDGLLRRAKAFQVQAQQLQTAIAKRQRAVFAQSLFQRSDSILSPQLWIAVAAGTPARLAEIKRRHDLIVNVGVTGRRRIERLRLVEQGLRHLQLPQDRRRHRPIVADLVGELLV